MTEHKQGCDALGGYGQGVGPCTCGGQAGGVLTPVAGMSPELNEVLEFLYGVGQMDSVWWGEGPPDDKPRYWWRSKLRNAIKAAFTRPTPAAAAAPSDPQNPPIGPSCCGGRPDCDAREECAAAELVAASPAAAAEVPAGPLLTFSLAYMDGVMEGEQPEIQRHWKRVREAALASPVAPAGAPTEPEWRDRAHKLIYDLFMHDEQVIRSVAAQDLKRLLGIVGPIPERLLSAGSQGEQHDSSHEAAPQSSVPSASPLSSLSETDESALPQWLPIETARKDSLSRLVWCPERQNIYAVSWDDFDGEWRIFGGDSLTERPTHWMPLPAPPRQGAQPVNDDGQLSVNAEGTPASSEPDEQNPVSRSSLPNRSALPREPL